MQFFIGLAVLMTASAAYLLHQFWRRTLTDASRADAACSDAESSDELKAA